MVTFLSAASALFLSSLIIVAIYRQKTHQVFQKHILLVAVYLLVCAIISNVVISVYVTTQGQAALQVGVILSKRVQVTFDPANPAQIRFEDYFLFVNGIAVATLILYAPYRFITYLRQTKPGEEVRRDTYLIILGISGFALCELLFEIVLPYVGIATWRAPGFILEMALVGLIAFGVRGGPFLQELFVQ